MAHPVAETFLKAADIIAGDANREGNCLRFSPGERIIFAGDIHGHRRNLARIIAYAALGANPDRRLILQEVIHGGPADSGGADRSVEVLMRAARLKISYPDQTFFLMGNHDVAQLAGQEITKDGRGVCEAFDAGLKNSFGDEAPEVCSAVHRMLRCQPLAGRCANGAFLTHSLPSPDRMGLVDWNILQRAYRDDDFRRGGALYEWTWGRAHTSDQLAGLARRLGVKKFFLGHQPVKTGYRIEHGLAVILASNHSHGVVVEFDAGMTLPDDGLAEYVRPIVSL